MKLTKLLLILITLSGIPTRGIAQDLPYHYGELTAPDYVKAVEAAGGTAIIPAGILEKHGPHLPLDTDAFDAALRKIEKKLGTG